MRKECRREPRLSIDHAYFLRVVEQYPPAQGAGGIRLYGSLMGVFWFGGLAIYGLGVYRMGTSGTVLGWPLLMGTIILTSNGAGIATGEWRQTSRLIWTYLGLGMTIILLALWILALAQRA